MSLILRRDKGSKLTITELDNNFEYLDNKTGDLTFTGLTMSSQVLDKDVTLVTKGEGSFVIQNDNNSSWVLNLGIKFNSTEDDIWGSSVTIDELGNTYTTGGDYNSDRGFIIKTNKVGEVIWQKTITQYSYGESIVYKNDKLFVFLSEDGNNSGILILKLDTDGNLLDQWSFQDNGSQSYGYEIDVDEDENVYWTGQKRNNDTGYDNIIIGKLNTLSNTIDWCYSVDGTSGLSDYGYSIKYKSGFVYITSSSNLYYSSIDDDIESILTIKLDLDGVIIWNKAVAISTNSQQGYSIVVDNDDNVYVVGYKESNYDNNTYNFLLKLNSSGSIVWIKSFILLSSDIESIDYNEIDNHLYITTSNNNDIFISKVSTDGDVIWQNRVGTNLSEYIWYDYGHRTIKVSDNQIYVTGYTYAPDNDYSNMFLLSYNKDGMTPSTYGDWTILAASFSFTTPINQFQIDTDNEGQPIYVGFTSSNPNLDVNSVEQTFIKTSFKIIDSKVNNYGGTYSTVSYDTELTPFNTKKTQLKVKGEINVNDLYVLPESGAKSGEVLSYPETGNVLKWGKPGTVITTDDFITPSTLQGEDTDYDLTENLTQVVGQYETIIVTLTSYDIADNEGGSYTINRRINSETIVSDVFNYDETPNVNWSDYGINTDVESIYDDRYTRKFKINCGNYNSNENSVVTIETSGGLSASIVVNQGYVNYLGFDEDFVEIDLNDYPYYPYDPASFENVFRDGFNNGVYSTYIQSDGKILVGGEFTSYGFYNSNQTNCGRIIRLNTDGSPDKSFQTKSHLSLGEGGFDNIVSIIKQQSDGKILVGGYFTAYQGITQSRITRLNLDGTIDTTFSIGTGFDDEVKTIEIQPNGKILVGGRFTDYNGTSANSIIRLNSNGSRDSTFVYGLGFDGYVNTIKYTSDDKILIGGEFGIYNGDNTTYLVLLDTDGTLDTTFNINAGLSKEQGVFAIEEQTDGRILIGGSFQNYNGYDVQNLFRLLPYSYWQDMNPLDFQFNDTNIENLFDGGVKTIKQQSDGKILIGGSFENYYDNRVGQSYYCPKLARLNYDGSFDSSFDTSILDLSAQVFSISIQSDNKIIVGGEFDNYSSRLIRLYSGLEVKYFNPEFLGETYDKIAIGSNSYLTFGGGSSQYNNLDFDNPNLPGIFISAADRSYQRVWVGVTKLTGGVHESPNNQWVLKVRYEGGAGSELAMDSSAEIEWEISFFDKEQYDNPTIDVKIGVNSTYSGPTNDSGMSLIKGKDFSVKTFLPIPVSSFILPNGWGLKQTKYEAVQFNPGTTVEVLDEYKVGQVNLPVAAADWTNNSGNVWGLRTYNGGTQIELSNNNKLVWFDFSDIPGYATNASNLRGGIIEYHAFATGNCNGTIIGSMTFVIDSNNDTNIIHNEVYSGYDLGSIVLWDESYLYDSPGSIVATDNTGGTTTLMIQWTSRLFFGSEYYGSR